MGMGLSMAASLPSAVVMAVYIGIISKTDLPAYCTVPLLHASLVGFGAAIASHPSINQPTLFGKKPDGSFPWWSIAAFFPYLLSLKAYVTVRRLRTTEPVFTEVYKGLFVGGWPSLQSDLPDGVQAVVDCTCELPRSLCVQGLPYLCVPTWDTRGPRPEEIEFAVQWLLKRYDGGENEKKKNRVLIHCAFGHGRSVTLLCALLVTLGVCDTWQNAESFVKSTRPLARLNQGQKISLVEWTANFHAKSGKDQGDNDSSNVQLHDFASDNGASLSHNSKDDNTFTQVLLQEGTHRDTTRVIEHLISYFKL